MIFKLEQCKLKVGGVMGAAPYKIWEVISHKVLNSGNNAFYSVFMPLYIYTPLFRLSQYI